MIQFVDPRDDPRPPKEKAAARTTNDPEALSEFHRLCREGRLYDVERWIRGGRPLQVKYGVTIKRRRLTSALEIALESRNHALVLLLLCNGYDLNIEPACPLDLALRARRWDLLDMLLEWGADVHRVSVDELLETYNSELWERFRAMGVDLTAGHAMAEALAYHTSNKPLFGFAKRHREHDPAIQKELNIALVHHADEGNEKGVMLCLWAGANPHAPAPSLRYPADVDEDDECDEADRFLGWTAVEEACSRGDVRILERLKPDPARDDFDELFQRALNEYLVRFLARLGLPKNVGAVIRAQFFWMAEQPFGLGRPRSVDTIRPLFEAGARWETSSPDDLRYVRRSLLQMSDYNFVNAMKLLASNDYCSASILHDLGRTPAMRERMRKVGFIPLPPDNRQWYYQSRPTRSRDVLLKFGIELKETRKPTPRQRAAPSRFVTPSVLDTMEIGIRHPDRQQIRLSRAALFEKVWSEPVEKLANAWGLSGRGLAKACHRLSIPVPPRGYWARVQHGQKIRRPRLPELPSGEAEEIVIHVPK